jgi:hypothetical protein
LTPVRSDRDAADRFPPHAFRFHVQKGRVPPTGQFANTILQFQCGADVMILKYFRKKWQILAFLTQNEAKFLQKFES